jgi:hypothetical protein
MSVEKTVEELQRVVTALPDNGSQTTITTKTTLRAGKVVTVQVETVFFSLSKKIEFLVVEIEHCYSLLLCRPRSRTTHWVL